MQSLTFRRLVVLAILALLFHTPAARRRHSRRRCSTHSCSWVWSSCTASCGGGTQHPIKTAIRGACGSCNMPSSPRNCNTDRCPVHCQWQNWGMWGSCSRTCGVGTQTRSRGKCAERCDERSCSGSSTETRSCSQGCCPVHCGWRPWGSWGSCSLSCGGGIQSRNRGYSHQASCGGKSCSGAPIDTRACNQQCCPANCVWGPWSKWNGCSKTCGGGRQTRKREHSIAATCGGLACPGKSTEERSCNSRCCAAHCSWASWSGWNACSKTCGGGKQARNRKYSVHSSCGGATCLGNSSEERECNVKCCPVDCSWAPWETWGKCSTSYGGGSQSRSRGHHVEATCGGNSCLGNSEDTQSCNSESRSVKCAWTSWRRWELCSASCGGGTQIRQRSTNSKEKCEGKVPDGSPSVKRVCNTHCCPVNCIWGEWNGWNGCTKSCGGGIQQRQRSIAALSLCGGIQCLGDKVETQVCNTQCCLENCIWGPWGEWDTCKKGVQIRTREISWNAACGGRQCVGHAKEFGSCNGTCYPIHCQWGSWGNWGDCSKTCETGSRYRNRSVLIHAACNGEVCEGANREEEECNTHCSPVNCSLTEWSTWTQCSHSCGAEGLQERTRKVFRRSCCGGDECDSNLLEERKCNRFCFNGEISTTSCVCEPGWKGSCCQEDVDECEKVNCTSHSKCVNSIGSYKCVCNHGYTKQGRDCLDDEIVHAGAAYIGSGDGEIVHAGAAYIGSGEAETPRQRNDSVCHENALGTYTYAGYSCACKPGYTGDGFSCADIDECSTVKNAIGSSGRGEELSGSFSGEPEELPNFEPCSVLAICINLPGSYTCRCQEGYGGDGFSCLEMNGCELEPCANGGTCIDHVTAYKCLCADGYTGANCDIDIYECKEGNHGCDPVNARCINTDGSHKCICKDGFVGDGKSCIETSPDLDIKSKGGRESFLHAVEEMKKKPSSMARALTTSSVLVTLAFSFVLLVVRV